jgi:hypothetical protein
VASGRFRHADLFLEWRMSELVYSIPWFAWIPIIAIVGGIGAGTLTKLVEMSHRHTERMAMIRMGMHPDAAIVADSKPAVEREV